MTASGRRRNSQSMVNVGAFIGRSPQNGVSILVVLDGPSEDMIESSQSKNSCRFKECKQMLLGFDQSLGKPWPANRFGCFPAATSPNPPSRWGNDFKYLYFIHSESLRVHCHSNPSFGDHCDCQYGLNCDPRDCIHLTQTNHSTLTTNSSKAGYKMVCIGLLHDLPFGPGYCSCLFSMKRKLHTLTSFLYQSSAPDFFLAA
jgi:hypothetical protein